MKVYSSWASPTNYVADRSNTRSRGKVWSWAQQYAVIRIRCPLSVSQNSDSLCCVSGTAFQNGIYLYRAWSHSVQYRVPTVGRYLLSTTYLATASRCSAPHMHARLHCTCRMAWLGLASMPGLLTVQVQEAPHDRFLLNELP